MTPTSPAIHGPDPPRGVEDAATSTVAPTLDSISASMTTATSTAKPSPYNAASGMSHAHQEPPTPSTARIPRTLPLPSPTALTQSPSPSSLSPSPPPQLPTATTHSLTPPTSDPSTKAAPLHGISFISFLEIDPRPSFVVSLSSSGPSVVYSNPALSNSPTLRSTILEPRANHAALWDGIAPSTTPILPTVTHLGQLWTRSVLGTGPSRYVVISASQFPTPAGEGTTAASTIPIAPAASVAPVAPATSAGNASVNKQSNPLIVSTQPPSRPATLLRSASTPSTTPTTTPTTTTSKQTLLLSTPEPPTPPASAVFSPPEADDEASKTKTAPNNDIPEQSIAPDYIPKFEAITSFMPVGMSVFDAAGNVSFANRAWYHIMGCPPKTPSDSEAKTEVVMGRAQFLACVDEDDQDAVRRFFAQAANVPNKTFGFRVKKHGQQASGVATTTATPACTSTCASSPPPLSATPNDGLPPTAEEGDLGDLDTTPKTPASLLSMSSSKTATPARTPTPSAANIDPRDNAPLRRNSLAPSSISEREQPRGSRVLATAHSETDSQGRLVRILVCLRDITEHQNIAEAADRHAQQANNLRRMAEFATVGMYDMDITGRLRGANRVFYEMCGLERTVDEDGEIEDEIIHPWLKCVVPEDQPLVQSCLDRLVSAAETDHQTVEVRFKTPWTADDGAGGRIVAPRWVEASFLPVKDSDGKVQSVTGCLSDISLRRWQLERERQVKEEAIESKRQQENFVDITSHEIRNPLTVIMHCGDAVLECLTKLRDDVRSVAGPVSNTRQRALAMLEDGIDYAEIIVGSALHQKAIVDDILTMSKLDSDLLAVTPVTVDPIEIVRSTLKMFEVQARQQNIQLRMAVDSSYYRELPASSLFPATTTTTVASSSSRVVGTPSPAITPAAIPFLVLDPSRVKQILINLLTNALKFTQIVDIREVTTTVSVSRSRPTDAQCHVSFVPPQPDNKLAPAYSYPGGGANVGTQYEAALASPPSPTSPISSSSLPSPSASSHPQSPMGESVFLIFEVKDTGEGLTKEGMESLFQKFVQAESNTHVKHGGSGLGLFISKRLAEIQNGAIGVASAPGVGSTFVFYIEAYIPPPSAVPEILSPGEAAKIALAAGLGSVTGGLTASTPTPTQTPTPKDDSRTSLFSESHPRSNRSSRDLQALGRSSTDSSGFGSIVDINESPYATATAATPASPPTTSPKQGESTTANQLASVPATSPEIRGVLLVEDNIVNQKVTRRYFEKSGFHVQVAANGIEAMDIIQASDRRVPGSYPISVVLMDMEMPVQDGLTCTRHIRALEASGDFAGGRIPVLMITGNARPEQIADARAAGCDDVVVKPFQMHLLFEHIKLVMQTLWEEDVRALAAGNDDADDDNDKENEAVPLAAPTPSNPAHKQFKKKEVDERLDEGVVLRRQNSDQP